VVRVFVVHYQKPVVLEKSTQALASDQKPMVGVFASIKE
jgi:hypothetical protein